MFSFFVGQFGTFSELCIFALSHREVYYGAEKWE